MHPGRGSRRSLVLALVLCAIGPIQASGGVEPAGEPGARSVVVRVSDGGFHWRDAGIGAAAVLAAGLVGVGLVLTIHTSRQGAKHEGPR